MSERQAGPATALLAHKGLAAPAGAAFDPAPALDPPSDRDSLPEDGAQAQAQPQAQALGPASRLPVDILAGRQGTPDLSLLSPDGPEAVVYPGAGPAAIPAPARGTVLSAPATALPEPTTKPEVPRPDPALRFDAGANSVGRAEPRRWPALAAGLALALVIGAAGYGYRGGWFDTNPQTPATASRVPAQIEPDRIDPEAAETALAPAATASAARSETPAQSSLAAPTVSQPDPSTEANRPSVDVVRIERDGAAVIAGRAAPGAELILLDNGSPIGTAQADSHGEWVFIPIDPLPSGAHDFGLVIKKIEGGASVPSLEKMPAAKEPAAPGVRGLNEPGTVAGAAAAMPIPPRKPDTGTKHGATAPLPFAVQLASVKTRAGAEREWRALRDRYPEILSGLPRSFDGAKLAGGDTVVRLRTGAFVNRAAAAALCARLVAKNQNCLVVHTTAKQ